MLTILILLTTFNIVMSTECVSIDCFVTNHNQTLWITSVVESCPLNKYPIDLLESFTCYSFNDSTLTGDRITDNCNLHYDCVKIQNVNETKPDVSLLGFLAILILFSAILTRI